MSEKIRLLPDSVANQIAAGEVVNRPASVVKELMENAVDAGSTTITVNFRDGGKELIQIIDDGCGMSIIDARMAFDRHATSKISKVDDIYSLATFGFRGEALASISAVAEVELRSRRPEDELGTKVEINGGRFIDQTAVSCQQGTQFMVKNLFFNVPARRRFLDKSTTEARHITAEFQRVALCNPQITFLLFNNDAPVYNLPASPLKQRIIGIVGKSIANNLLDVSTETTIVKVEGFVGRPDASKQNNKEQFLFVNGRYFKSAYFHKAVLQAYEKLIPANTQPAYFIYLTIDPLRIDVNVHPQKTEVKFDDGGAVWQIINAAVRESLAKLGVVPMMDFDMNTNVEIPVFREGTVVREPGIKANPDFNPFIERQSSEPVSRRSGADISDFSEIYQMQGIEIVEEEDISILEYISGEESQQSTIEIDNRVYISDALPFAGRYGATIIDGVMTVIDTLRAQECVLYDRYRTMLGNGSSISQQLLFPETIILSIDDYSLIEESAEDFAQCGFDIVFKDEHTIEVTGIPADFTSCPISEVIYEMLDSIRDGASTPAELKSNRLAEIMSRIGVGAVRRLSSLEIDQLLSDWRDCSNPNYTPSGKKVTIAFTEEEIKKRFN